MSNLVNRAFARLAVLLSGKEVRMMLVRLYAGEIIAEKITEDKVPSSLRAQVHQYLVDMGYYDE